MLAQAFLLLPRDATQLCTRFIANIVPDHPLYPLINSTLIDISVHYSLTSGSQYRLLPARIDKFSKFVTIKFKPG